MTGGIRWRWLLRCLLVVVPLWVVYVGVGFLGGAPKSAPPTHWVLLLGMVVVLTPLQAAGEEYLFRGWILQNVGSWFRRPLLGLVVGSAISTVVFASAHGSPDPWVLGSLGSLAVAACVLAWRTGGLEAGIAMHAVNNLAAFGVVLVAGGWDQAFVTGQSRGSPGSFLLDLAVNAVALALIWWQAKRTGLAWRYRPQPPYPPVPPPPGHPPGHLSPPLPAFPVPPSR